MKKTERLEMEINSSRLFSMERGTSEYQAEAYRMVELLWEYSILTSGGKYEKYAVEIVDTAKKCISGFCPENGFFLHYFNSSMAKAYRKACAKEQNEEARGGIHVSSKDDRNIYNIRKFMRSRGIEELNDDQCVVIADGLGLTVEYVKELLVESQEISVVSTMAVNEDGEQVDLLEMIAVPEFESPEQQREAVAKVLLVIAEEYASQQDRTKPIISAYLTAMVCKEFEMAEFDLLTYPFIDQRIITEYSSTGRIPTKRDIATYFGKHESSINRTISTFLDKLKEKIKTYSGDF